MPYSVKPGRGPSLLGGLFMIAFGIVVAVIISSASESGAPDEIRIVGAIMIGFAVIGGIYQLYNATAKNRLSDLDVTTGDEEPDPLARALGHGTAEKRPADSARAVAGKFCPYCGAGLEQDFKFCPSCGKGI